ncbi:MAG: ribonuclease HII [Verrucomicrobiota bacterium]
MPRRIQSTDRFEFERECLARGLRRVAGVDEAGRGPLAGPVVAAAVILPEPWIQEGMPADLQDLNDSKQLTEGQREQFFQRLTGDPLVESAIAIIDAAVIDAINILQATHRGMNEALTKLKPQPEHALVDGTRVRSLILPQTPLVKGDARSYSIAAASVLAKVTRDRWMREADARWPEYGFARHKGYPTPDHLDALQRLGPCPIHRRSFAPLRKPEPELFPP